MPRKPLTVGSGRSDASSGDSISLFGRPDEPAPVACQGTIRFPTTFNARRTVEAGRSGSGALILRGSSATLP